MANYQTQTVVLTAKADTNNDDMSKMANLHQGLYLASKEKRKEASKTAEESMRNNFSTPITEEMAYTALDTLNLDFKEPKNQMILHALFNKSQKMRNDFFGLTDTNTLDKPTSLYFTTDTQDVDPGLFQEALGEFEYRSFCANKKEWLAVDGNRQKLSDANNAINQSISQLIQVSKENSIKNFQTLLCDDIDFAYSFFARWTISDDKKDPINPGFLRDLARINSGAALGILINPKLRLSLLPHLTQDDKKLLLDNALKAQTTSEKHIHYHSATSELLYKPYAESLVNLYTTESDPTNKELLKTQIESLFSKPEISANLDISPLGLMKTSLGREPSEAEKDELREIFQNKDDFKTFVLNKKEINNHLAFVIAHTPSLSEQLKPAQRSIITSTLDRWFGGIVDWFKDTSEEDKIKFTNINSIFGNMLDGNAILPKLLIEPTQQIQALVQPATPVRHLSSRVQPNTPVQPLIQQPSTPVQPLIQQPNTPVQPLIQQPNTPVQPLIQQPNTPVQPLIQQPNTPVQPLIQQPDTPVQPLIEQAGTPVEPLYGSGGSRTRSNISIAELEKLRINFKTINFNNTTEGYLSEDDELNDETEENNIKYSRDSEESSDSEPTPLSLNNPSINSYPR